jgi:malate synthase
MSKKILKINLPLSENSLYVEVVDENQPITEILIQVANELKEQGRFHEAQQLFAYITDKNSEIHDVIEKKKDTLKNGSNGKENTEIKIEFKLK